MVDVRELLEQFNIPYIDHGPNVKKGWLCIHCPLCGYSDPSFHLGINPETLFCGCWRDNTHRGNFRFFLGRIANLSTSALDAIFGQKRISPVSKLISDFNAINKSADADKLKYVEWPSDMIRICKTQGPRGTVWNYLLSRGYTEEQAERAAEMFDLRCAASGPFALRVIFPIRMNGKLVGWTGRDVTGTSPMRYKTESNGWGKSILYYHKIKNIKNIVFTEGPFDALRINVYAAQFGLSDQVAAVAMLGTAIVGSQVSLLARLMTTKSRFYVCLDQDAAPIRHKILKDLALLHPVPLYLPEGVKDAALLSSAQATQFIRDLIK